MPDKFIRKFERLEAWKFRGNKVSQLWQDFTYPYFIFLQASKLISCQTSERNRNAIAFTMAEILISLTIIGVIATIVLPALRNNINERVWDTQRRALYTRVSHAMNMMPALNGFGEFKGTFHYEAKCHNNTAEYCNDYIDNITKDTAAMTFVTNGLSKVMKLNNICDNDHLDDCGIPSTYKTNNNVTKSMPGKLSQYDKMFIARKHIQGDASNALLIYGQNFGEIAVDTKTVGVETANGESMLVLYNPKCVGGVSNKEARFILNNFNTEGVTAVDEKIRMFQHLWEKGFGQNSHAQSNMCVTFIYDLNGKKGPNKIFKDMGVISVFYPTDPKTVMPIFSLRNVPHPDKRNNPEPADSDIGSSNKYKMQYKYAAKACELEGNEYRLPTLEELKWLRINRESIGNNDEWKYQTKLAYWGGGDSIISDDYAWVQDGRGITYPHYKNLGANDATYTWWYVRCVKK